MLVNVGTKYTLTQGGQNLKAAAGTYDVYFSNTSGTFYLVTAGAADPTVNEPADTWTLRGDINNSTWYTDFEFKVDGNLLVVKNITFQDTYGQGANFKVLNNGKWIGTPDARTYQLGEAITLNNGEGGSNICVNATINTAQYDIYLNVIKNCVCVVAAGGKPTI
jgi:hypothetical protein